MLTTPTPRLEQAGRIAHCRRGTRGYLKRTLGDGGAATLSAEGDPVPPRSPPPPPEPAPAPGEAGAEAPSLPEPSGTFGADRGLRGGLPPGRISWRGGRVYLPPGPPVPASSAHAGRARHPASTKGERHRRLNSAQLQRGLYFSVPGPSLCLPLCSCSVALIRFSSSSSSLPSPASRSCISALISSLFDSQRLQSSSVIWVS